MVSSARIARDGAGELRVHDSRWLFLFVARDGGDAPHATGVTSQVSAQSKKYGI